MLPAKIRGCWIHSLWNVANICHLMPDTDLYKKQLHYCDKFNKIISSGNPTNWGQCKNIVPQSNFRQLPEMGLTVRSRLRTDGFPMKNGKCRIRNNEKMVNCRDMGNTYIISTIHHILVFPFLGYLKGLEPHLNSFP